jgi:hypothetical protein
VSLVSLWPITNPKIHHNVILLNAMKYLVADEIGWFPMELLLSILIMSIFICVTENYRQKDCIS